MTLHNPPIYRYALYEEWDKDTFKYLQQFNGQIPSIAIIGKQSDRDQFLTTLIRSQKALSDWRDMLKEVLSNMQEGGSLDCPALNAKFPPENISKSLPVWVTYREDQTVNDFIDQLETRTISFTGDNDVLVEFILRFLLGQLGHDWEQTILMIWEMLGDLDALSLKELNAELRKFDYLQIFS